MQKEDKNMVFKDEISLMNHRYDHKRMRNIHLSRPSWLRGQNALSAIYNEKKQLVQSGRVVYAYVIQANTMLFHALPPIDCPASIVYSTDPYVLENPEILKLVAEKIYGYKNVDPEQVPEEWRELARITTDESDYADFRFSICFEGRYMDIHFLPVMVYRKLLPKKKLCGSLIPVLTEYECRSVLILPKRYWSKGFKKAWVRKEL